jgi:hypothetical protein
MAPDLSDRYNDGIVPQPSLSIDIPRLPRPAHRPTPAQVAQARIQFWLAIITLVALGLISLLLIGWGLYTWLGF